MLMPLDNIRVLDLSRFIAGPHCASLLGDMGADVIKVERPGGEDSRRVAPFYKGEAIYTLAFNRNKRAITLNTRTEEGRALLRRLVAWADVIVENYRPGTMAAMGFDYPELQRLNPRIILTSISGAGQTGPLRDAAMFDSIAQARSGLMSRTGASPDNPQLAGTYIGDYVTAVYAAFGTMLALYARERTGVGQVVDVALLDALFLSMATFALQQELTGQPLPKAGNRDLHAAPGNLFPAADGSVYVHAGTDPLFARLASVLGRPQLLEDPRFWTVEDRMAHVEEIESVVRDWTGARTVAEIETELTAAGVPCSRPFDMADAVGSAQTRARDLLVSIEHPELGTVTVPGIPVKLSETSGSVRLAPPRVGEHNREVYCGLLGLTEQALDDLRERGVI